MALTGSHICAEARRPGHQTALPCHPNALPSVRLSEISRAAHWRPRKQLLLGASEAFEARLSVWDLRIDDSDGIVDSIVLLYMSTDPRQLAKACYPTLPVLPIVVTSPVHAERGVRPSAQVGWGSTALPGPFMRFVCLLFACLPGTLSAPPRWISWHHLFSKTTTTTQLILAHVKIPVS
jgi:hypothetical protein